MWWIEFYRDVCPPTAVHFQSLGPWHKARCLSDPYIVYLPQVTNDISVISPCMLENCPVLILYYISGPCAFEGCCFIFLWQLPISGQLPYMFFFMQKIQMLVHMFALHVETWQILKLWLLGLYVSRWNWLFTLMWTGLEALPGYG